VNGHEPQFDIEQHLGGLEILGLQSSKTTSIRARALKRRLLAMSEASMQDRAQSLQQFSFAHFRCLSKQALHRLCNDAIAQPFDFANATRPSGFSSDLLTHCVDDFLGYIPSQSWLWHFVAPLLGSALLLASYPPRAHSTLLCANTWLQVTNDDLDFAPDYLFEELYSKSCRTAIRSYSPHIEIQEKFVAAVFDEFRIAFAKYNANKSPSSHLHQRTLVQHCTRLAEIKSHRSCFSCFMRMPEKVLACGHALCDVCIRIFGTRARSERNTYELPECILCGVNHRSSVFRFVPPTAGIRVLSVDGGGVKGIIPLTFLQHLDALLAPLGCSVKDYFDFVCGTSAGKQHIENLYVHY
jgi:hypothetical protein